MNDTIPEHYGIPTLYRGVRMRSRLEARWAMFFDELGWRWTYEPFDLNSYIPDFVLAFEHGPLLVEVKPDVELDALRKHVSRIQRSGWHGEALVVGSALLRTADAHPVLGLFGEREPSPDGSAWFWDTARGFFCLNCCTPSVLCESASWRCRACGAGEGNEHLGTHPFVDAWVKAGNLVQWRPE